MLERRRVAKIEQAPRPASTPAAPVERAAVTTSTPVPAVSLDAVQARDAAVIYCLTKAPASFDELLAAMPAEAELTTDTLRREALSRSLSRLRMKTREIRTVGADRWELNP